MGRCQSSEAVQTHWVANDDIEVCPTWHRKTIGTFEYCSTSKRKCVNAGCNGGNPFEVWVGKRRPTGKDKNRLRKGHVVGKLDKKRIWNAHKIDINPQARICRNCSIVLEKDIEKMRFECDTAHYPSLDTIDAMHMTYDIKNNVSDDEDDKKEHGGPARQPLLDVQTLSTKAVKTLTGISKENLLGILDVVNPLLEQNRFPKLKLWQLFIAFYVWRSACGYRSAAVLFGYKDHSGICKVCGTY